MYFFITWEPVERLLNLVVYFKIAKHSSMKGEYHTLQREHNLWQITFTKALLQSTDYKIITSKCQENSYIRAKRLLCTQETKLSILFALFYTMIKKSRVRFTQWHCYAEMNIEYLYLPARNPAISILKANTKVKAFRRVMFPGSLQMPKRNVQVRENSIPF